MENNKQQGEIMGVAHLALSDLNKKLKEIGLSKTQKPWLPLSQLNIIISENYPDVPELFGKVNIDNVEIVMQHLGFEYRKERVVKKPKEDKQPTVIISRPVITSYHRKLLKLFKHRGFITEELDFLTSEIISTTLLKHYPKIVAHDIKDGGSRKLLKWIKDYKPDTTHKQSFKPRNKMPDDFDVTSKEFLNTWEWKTLRYEVLLEQGAVCKCCGAKPSDGVTLCVDHIKPRRTHPQLALDKTNLQVLCNDCNMGKGSWDTTNWNE